MRIFITGATGYIGGVVAEKLRNSGHSVVALARSAESIMALEKLGIETVRGDLADLTILADAARAADGVIHAAFKQDGHDFVASVATEAKAVRALIYGLEGSAKPLILTSGTGVLGDTGKRIFDEETPLAARGDDSGGPMQAIRERIATEQVVLKANGLRGIVLRPPNVYGRSDGKAVITMLRAAGRSLGAVPYATGTADNRWSFVHVDDLADLYVLALGGSAAGSLYHAGAETGLRTKAIAEAVSHGVGLGGKTAELDILTLGEVFGATAMADYWASNGQSSSEKAQRLLEWRPRHTQMLTEIARQPQTLNSSHR